jgi:hypothetical protein
MKRLVVKLNEEELIAFIIDLLDCPEKYYMSGGTIIVDKNADMFRVQNAVFNRLNLKERKERFQYGVNNNITFKEAYHLEDK